jgi:hypothetical protein
MQCGFAILLSMGSLALQHFSILSHKRDYFQKKNLLNTKCVFWFSLRLLSETFVILRRNERDIIINIYWSSLMYPLFLSDFNETWVFWTDFRKKYSNTKFHENLSSGSRVVPCGRTEKWTGWQTGMTKLIVAFRNFANARKSEGVTMDGQTFCNSTRSFEPYLLYG